MKKLLLVFLLFFSAKIFAQTIDANSMWFITTPVPSADTVHLVATANFPGGPCQLTAYSDSLQNDTIIITGFYCFESANGGCATTDTFLLGVFSPGTYVARIILITSPSAAPCGSGGFISRDIKFKSFTVGNSTGVQEAVFSKTPTYPNPASEKIIFQTKNRLAEVKVFDETGKEVMREKLSAEGSIDVSGLAEGIYFFQIKNSEKSETGKVIIRR